MKNITIIGAGKIGGADRAVDHFVENVERNIEAGLTPREATPRMRSL